MPRCTLTMPSCLPSSPQAGVSLASPTCDSVWSTSTRRRASPRSSSFSWPWVVSLQKAGGEQARRCCERDRGLAHTSCARAARMAHTAETAGSHNQAALPTPRPPEHAVAGLEVAVHYSCRVQVRHGCGQLQEVAPHHGLGQGLPRGGVPPAGWGRRGGGEVRQGRASSKHSAY